MLARTTETTSVREALPIRPSEVPAGALAMPTQASDDEPEVPIFHEAPQ